MAFLAQLTAQTEELVTAVTSIKPEDDTPKFTALRDATLRSLRHHSFLRTNQFDVENRLDGFQERFAVVGRDELAEALYRRRTLLFPQSTKWTPDILDFLLELSDQPIEKASLDELNKLSVPEVSPKQPTFRWEDIAEEDGWANEKPLWQKSRYEGESDYDEHDDEDLTEASSDGTALSSVGAVDPLQTAVRDLTAASDSKEDLSALLQAIRDSQIWGTKRGATSSLSAESTNDKVLVSELYMIRETLFMLQGLKTTLFDSECTPNNAFRLSDVSQDVHDSLVESVAECGYRLLPLRNRVSGTSRPEKIPLLQVFQECIHHRLVQFDKQLSSIQARYVDIKEDVLVSLMAVMDELQPSLSCLFALSAVAQRLSSERNARAFFYLELLFGATAITQLEGNQLVYEFLGTVFFECFQVYLRPIRLWMEDGRVTEGDKIFFVAGASTHVPASQIWQRQFKLLRTSNGVLHAPKFLQPAASRIFTTGKSIVVLKQLGRYDKGKHLSAIAASEPKLDFPTVCPPGSEFAPFSQLFEEAFELWIQSKHHAASKTVQATLFGSCGLWLSMQSLHCLYLSSDGAMVDAFATSVFHSLDTKNPRWHDKYTLTELAREAFGAGLDAPRLSVVVDKTADNAASSSTRKQPGGDENNPAVARQSLRKGLARIKLNYQLPWPVQIVAPAESMAGYQSLFTLLLQIRRATSILSRHRLLDDGGGADAHLPTAERAMYFALRTKLLWFCNSLHSYLTTLVIAPRIAALRVELERAEDIDAMIDVHTNFVKSLVEEACLGSKLQPIRECVLDLLDLSLRLEDARQTHSARATGELQETWRLSVLSSPFTTPTRKPTTASKHNTTGSVRRKLFTSRTTRDHGRGGGGGDEDFADIYDESEDDSGNLPSTPLHARPVGRALAALGGQQSYSDVLQAMATDYSNYLRFIAGGLRGVARASDDAVAAAKWDMLAEMLEAGTR